MEHACSVVSGLHDDMLSPAPMPLEMGIQRLPDGRLQVAARTELPNCAGRMLDWWFKFFDTTQHIRWWHPHDHHTLHGWDASREKGVSFIGATVRAVESLGEIPPVAAVLKFHDPKLFFTDAALANAWKRREVSGLVCARIAFGDEPRLDASGDPLDGEMIHLARDTSHGAVLRSRFVLGASGQRVPDMLGLELMRHCYNEFSCLARFLPSLYYGEHANGEKGPLAW
ncbi:DAPG hydrolase family protein [Chromobacterium sphagni]|uniref:Hydrolase n=1 Tax=Chromobacterium sphagni TaxID=1903179 RepID=A0A1S1X594_9NEIS|nr:hydrolase [Chromobacterium sphagni]OHX14610.1 hydrolase [Chromobacterium sphagni]OHX20722.1 hydrolase [Chromobacterium sphagni]